MSSAVGHSNPCRSSALAGFVLLYTVLYASFGVLSPFLAVWLSERGLTASQIALVVGSGTLVRLVTGPLAGQLADRLRAWRGILWTCTLGAGLMGFAYVTSEGVGALIIVGLVQAALLAPVVPLADALALSASVQRSGRGFEYGLVRGVGSAAFVLGALVAGHLAASRGVTVLVWLQGYLLCAAALAVLSVPAVVAGPQVPYSGGFRDFLRLARQPRLGRLLVVAALVLGSHALHDTFVVIRWRDAGVSTMTASLLWSEQVIAEVAVFLLAGPALLRRLALGRAVMLAAAAGVVRWWVLGTTAGVVPLMLVEPLHGLTFALFHLAAMRVIATEVPPRLAATAQALYATFAVGVATALVTLLSGYLYQWLEGGAFFVMALLCAAAVPLAQGIARQRSEDPARRAFGVARGNPASLLAALWSDADSDGDRGEWARPRRSGGLRPYPGSWAPAQLPTGPRSPWRAANGDAGTRARARCEARNVRLQDHEP